MDCKINCGNNLTEMLLLASNDINNEQDSYKIA